MARIVRLPGDAPNVARVPRQYTAAHEVQFLLWLAQRVPGSILEIGCNVGTTTLDLSSLGKTVHAVDAAAPEGMGGCQSHEAPRPEEVCKLARHLPNVHVHVRSVDAEFIRSLNLGVGLVFIDGDHGFESVKRDTEAVLASGFRGAIAWHDYANPFDWIHVKRYLDGSSIPFSVLENSILAFHVPAGLDLSLQPIRKSATRVTPPDFSLLHPTARLPDGWREAYETWSRMCSDPGRCEYILIVDRDQWEQRPRWFSEGIGLRIEPNMGRRCTVDGWNTAARLSRGRVLMCVADDWFPLTPNWDGILRSRINMDDELAPWINDRLWPWLMTHPICTRAYYERPGRGGHPNGELFYPGYISQGNDDDFTLVAQRDGVAFPIPEIVCDHRHPEKGSYDETYSWSNRPEAETVRNQTLARRTQENFAQ
jgi:hypothetical protein